MQEAITWSENSWHFRLNKWAYKELARSLEDSWRYYQPSWTRHLCPYMRHTVVAMLGLPFLFVWRMLDEKWYAQIVFVVSLVIFSASEILSVLFPIGFWKFTEWGFLAAGLAGCLTVGAAAATYGMQSLIRYGKFRIELHNQIYKEKLEAGLIKPRQPNLFIEWIKSSHRQICPAIQWEKKDADTTTSQSR